jgi:aryl-alcohol dehydrogenase-like predicted oxidoreductase
MKHIRLGDLDVSRMGLGAMGMSSAYTGAGTDDAESIRTIHRALELGVTFIDTAQTYGPFINEELVGRAIKGRRDEVVVATKFGMNMEGLNGNDFGARGSRRYVVRAVEASLRRLETDHIDLYQLHEPDPATPIEETLAALDDLVHAGKVRYLGNSNFAGWQIADADWTARAGNLTPFISAQNRYSLLQRHVEAEVVPACEQFGLGLLPFFPLDSGLLSGKYRRGEKPAHGTRLSLDRYQRFLDGADWDVIEALTRFGAERGHSLLEVAIAGLAARPAVTSVIAGATSAEQVQANAAAGSWQLTADDLGALDAILDG